MSLSRVSKEDARLYAFRRNVVVAASAGTGKTHRLTSLYALLALGLTSAGQASAGEAAPPLSPERIVATTFSRAAAGEIGRRVEAALLAVAEGPEATPPALGAVIGTRLAELERPPSARELRARAASALEAWGSARIDTLHGLAGEIVQEGAHLVGVAEGSRMLDEEESRALSELAVDEALEAALEAGGPREEAARAAIAVAGGVAALRDHFTRLVARLDDEGASPETARLADHEAGARAILDRATEVARAARASGDAVLEGAARAFVEAGAAALEEAARGAGELGEGRRAALEEAARRFVGIPLPRKASAKTPAFDAFLAFREGLPSGTREERAGYLALLLAEAPRLSPRERGIRALLADARGRAARLRRRARALAFGDLLRLGRDALRDHPEFSARVRGRVEALLVDEFQDTSGVQRDLVYLLRERPERAAERPRGTLPSSADLLPSGLFLVGDRKQSIYAFRGADVSIFCRVCVELAGEAARLALGLPELEGGEAGAADFVALRESRRSGRAVLAFVNEFSARDFGAGASAKSFEIAYGEAERLAPPAEEDARRDPGEVVLIADEAGPEGPPGAEREARLAAAFALREVREGRASFRDVAVLARRRSTLPFLELALTRLGAPYVVAGRALYDATEVRDAAALLRLCVDPRDRLALATVLRGPVVALSDLALALLSTPEAGLSVPLEPGLARREEGEPFAERLARVARLCPDEAARLEAFLMRFSELRRAALRMPPGEALRQLVRVLDLDRVLAALPRAEARLGNLDRLVAIARARGGSVAAFSRFLDRRIEDEADEAEAAVFSPEDDAVRLTTVHASKGLDFPVVALVDLGAKPVPEHRAFELRPAEDGSVEGPWLLMRHVLGASALPEVAAHGAGRSAAFVPPALAEARAEQAARVLAERKRLTYVAATRAKRTLALVLPDGKPRPGSAHETLAAGLAEGWLEPLVGRRLEARTLLAEPPLDASELGVPSEVLAPEPGRPELPPALEALVASPAALSLFAGCPRRYRLRVVAGLEEPTRPAPPEFGLEPPPDRAPGPAAWTLRGLGAERTSCHLLADRGLEAEEAAPRDVDRAAHRVLEAWPLESFGSPPSLPELRRRLALEGVRESDPALGALAEALALFLGGAFAAALRAGGAKLLRGDPFALTLPASGRAPSLVVRGAFDLLVAPAKGPVEVLDFTLAPPARGERAGFELRLLALAARARFPGRPVRAGAIVLGGPPDPVYLDGQAAIPDEAHARFEDELTALSARLSEARWSGRFPGLPAPACSSLGCGFFEACHPEGD